MQDINEIIQTLEGLRLSTQRRIINTILEENKKEALDALSYEQIIDYDKENDILYINFFNPPLKATFTHRIGNVVMRWHEHRIAGITIIDVIRVCQEGRKHEEN